MACDFSGLLKSRACVALVYAFVCSLLYSILIFTGLGCFKGCCTACVRVVCFKLQLGKIQIKIFFKSCISCLTGIQDCHISGLEPENKIEVSESSVYSRQYFYIKAVDLQPFWYGSPWSL